MLQVLLLTIAFFSVSAFSQEADLSQLDKCQSAAIEIGKGYLMKDVRINQADSKVDFDAPGQTFGAGGMLIYCVAAINFKTHQMVTQDVVVNPKDCRETIRIDLNSPDSACRELESMNGHADPSDFLKRP